MAEFVEFKQTNGEPVAVNIDLIGWCAPDPENQQYTNISFCGDELTLVVDIKFVEFLSAIGPYGQRVS